ncbi:MAG: LEA type 2 family protein [Nitrosopumilus sp.]|nr:LEA type 2 family protein [Nitrosopumilus sp.]
MRKALGISIFFIILLIVVGLFVYSYTQLTIRLNDITFHSIDFEPLSWSTLMKLGLNTLSGNWFDVIFDLIREINLNFIFELSNNGLLPVYIPDLYYDLLINNVSVGNGYSKINTTLNPGQTKKIILFQNIQKNNLSPVVDSILLTQGEIDVTVKGTLYFKLLVFDISLPFESSKQISIYDEIKKTIFN